MEENDPIGNRLRSAFNDYEKEPPARVWENLRRELHPEPKPESVWSRIAGFSFFPERKSGFYLVMGGVAVILFLAVVYIASGDRHSVHGHAYSGDVRLCRGTAVLFQVADKAMPWDSATHYRSAIIDENGQYKFHQVESGKYLLRIAPEGNSEAAKKFLPSWFDQHENADSCHLIIIKNEDVSADVHLIPNSEIAK